MVEDKVREVLERARVIAVVGASRNPEKAAHRVPAYLKSAGYKIVPVNPSASEILGVRAYPSLLDLPEDVAREIDVVEVFRPSEEVLDVVRQAIALKRKYGRPWAIWLQLGIVNERAKEEAEREGIKVIMDKCMMIEHRRLYSKVHG